MLPPPVPKRVPRGLKPVSGMDDSTCRATAVVTRARSQSALKRPAYDSYMAKPSGKGTQKLARSIVNENPGGIHYSENLPAESRDSQEYRASLGMES